MDFEEYPRNLPHGVTNIGPFRLSKLRPGSARADLEAAERRGTDGFEVQITDFGQLHGALIEAQPEALGVRGAGVLTSADLGILNGLPLKALSCAGMDFTGLGGLEWLYTGGNPRLAAELPALIWASLASLEWGSLDALTTSPSLRYLRLREGRLRSLEGVQECGSLERLDVWFERSLQDLSALTGAASLVELNVENCRKMRFDTLQSRSLTTLSIENSGKLPNLAFLGGLPELREFALVGTTVVDGDLSALENGQFGWLFFEDRKHYSHRLAELHARHGITGE